ncbi:MAG: proline--tRNA ligase [Desulfovibrionaceae bacterium]|nr:proline--tRNA ligase [Desulfovibrionaceae bacterium]
MRWSQWYIPTLKEAPGDAEVVSHKLMVRAGMIRKLTSGVYSWLPLGMKTLQKITQIVREEMNRAGAQEILMPAVQPADLWRESGRWAHYGKELLRFKDRHDRDYCYGPTHEEVVTDLVRGEVRSYRQLPLCLYQIQWKFRDEVRPRFGLMRGREFLMKDAYSFDRDREGADRSYDAMYEAYKRIFSRLGLQFRPVQADTGSIGGSSSHEFMVLAETGEDTIAYCKSCDWSANIEQAEIKASKPVSSSCPENEEVSTPGMHTIDEVSSFLKCPPEKMIKTLLYVADGKPVAALVRGDREVNEIKLKNFLHAETDVVLALPEQVEAWTGAAVGFAGPVGLSAAVRIVADNELLADTGYVAGANKTDTHLLNVDPRRDAPSSEYGDIRNITQNDVCPVCGGSVGMAKGIEVGHIFKLGTKYSKAMNAVFLDENGKEQVMIMGCYGIGVSRVVAACIEQNFDHDGILFPPQAAPFDVHVICLDPKDEAVLRKTEAVESYLLNSGLDPLIDDREERPGVKFKDADLIGIPMQIIIGGKGLSKGVIEVKNRKTGEKETLSAETFAPAFEEWKNRVRKSWKIR